MTTPADISVTAAPKDDSLICGCFDLGCSPFSNNEEEAEEAEKEVTPVGEVDVPRENPEWKKVSHDDLTASTDGNNSGDSGEPTNKTTGDALVGSKKKTKKSKARRFHRRLRNSISKRNSVSTEVKRLKVW